MSELHLVYTAITLQYEVAVMDILASVPNALVAAGNLDAKINPKNHGVMIMELELTEAEGRTMSSKKSRMPSRSIPLNSMKLVVVLC